MKVGGKHYRTVWQSSAGAVQVIDQRHLPFRFEIETLQSVTSVAAAIRDMHVRGAGCIGATAGYGMILAAVEAAESENFEATLVRKAGELIVTRPTAVNLRWAVERQLGALASVTDIDRKVAMAQQTAAVIADEDADACAKIGEHGLSLIERVASKKAPGQPINVLTHCNAGWLAFVDYGSATAPIYAAHDAGLPVHVWVDETRPRNQGARLTAWELAQHGVPHTVIVDNAGGHLMQRGQVDMVITGTDRTSRNGDVANKIGTYLKALAAHDNGIPFYVALPSSTFDWKCRDGMKIPIEERGSSEVTEISGQVEGGHEKTVRLASPESSAGNPAFDVTPARLVSGFITERGCCRATEGSILADFPEHRSSK